MVLLLPKASRYVKTLKVRIWDTDKNNKLMSFCIDDKELLGKNETIWTKIKELRKY